MKGAKEKNMQVESQTKEFKLLNLDNFYILFFIIIMAVIITYKNYLDISYFLLVTINYIRLKIHQSSNN